MAEGSLQSAAQDWKYWPESGIAVSSALAVQAKETGAHSWSGPARVPQLILPSLERMVPPTGRETLTK